MKLMGMMSTAEIKHEHNLEKFVKMVVERQASIAKKIPLHK